MGPGDVHALRPRRRRGLQSLHDLCLPADLALWSMRLELGCERPHFSVGGPRLLLRCRAVDAWQLGPGGRMSMFSIAFHFSRAVQTDRVCMIIFCRLRRLTASATLRVRPRR